ncbi:MAG: Crp/Fnr family transcriptional regulator [Pseudomonadota bacterium]
MTLQHTTLRQIPLFTAMQEQHVQALADLFEGRRLEAGQEIFAAGSVAEALYLLTEGEVGLYENGDVRFRLLPVAPIGELGAITGLRRNTTARALLASTIWQVSSSRLLEYLQQHADVAAPFYQSMLQILADKTRRDQTRIEDMRGNIIRTQKAMKRARDLVLESVETPISENLHQTLEELIRKNRRVNYRVAPPPELPSHLRLDDHSQVELLEMSRTHFLMRQPAGSALKVGDSLSGVLCLVASGQEFPVSGSVVDQDGDRVDLQLDHLIDDFSLRLDDYLTRVQMLDFVV